jgi:hypothetical protein
MINQLIETLLWCSQCDKDELLDPGGNEVSQQLRDKLEADYREFTDSLPDGFVAEDYFICSGDASEQLAHDYIMTRNRHGCGFWDGDWGKEMGDLLTKLAQHKPEIEPYVGDDGLIHA